MGRLDDIVSAQFAQWEKRGRGWQVWPQPVAPEPAFLPFVGFRLPPPNLAVNDGRKPGFFASLFDRLERSVNPQPASAPPEAEPDEPEPEVLEREPLVELQTALPANLDIRGEAFAAFLEQLAVCSEPVVFELLGTSDCVVAQFAAHRRDTPILQRQVAAYFPEVVFLPEENTLVNAWTAHDGEVALVEFGLEREFLLPLATGGKLDPFIGLVGVMSELAAEEVALFQVIFQPAQHRWAQSAFNAVTNAQGQALFVNRPDLPSGAQDKFAAPLYGAVVRIATKAGDFERVWQLARELAFALRVFANPAGNALIPLRNDDYPFAEHEEDMLFRQSRRSGMLLNASELTGFVHFPAPTVRSPKLRRQVERTRPAPASVTGNPALVLGENRHHGRTVSVGLTTEQRVRHLHVIGASGTGKSTLLFNLIRQDIEHGEGVAMLDPHGDLVERILGIIPAARIGDVVLVDPADEDYSIGFNILSAHSDLEKRLLASDLVSVFQRLSTSWGDQMGSVLQNAILAFLESSQGGTLADLRRFLLEPAFREQFLTTVSDPELLYYWRKGFAQLSGNKSIGPVLTRLETFLAPKPIRYMVSQQQNRLDFADILDTGKILLVKLPQGQMGKENAFLLGSLLVAKCQQLAMSRQAQRAESRRPFWLYVDEFQHFITPSMAEILSGARKYRLGLILAHQELRQLERDREVASAVLSNPYARVVFRVGDADARTLENGFANFEARDLQNLATGQAICRVEKAEGDFNLAVSLPEEPAAHESEATRQAVIAASRARYATPRATIEAELRAKFEAGETKPAKTKSVAPPVPKDSAPKVAEVPTVPVSEREQPVAETPVVAPPEVAEVAALEATEAAKFIALSPDLGKGGAQHKAIQQRLKAAAEQLGFHAIIEKAIPNGSVDLALERGGHSIACEITVTTTIDHEVGNVQKCLRAGFGRVAVICQEVARLEKIRAAVQSSLSVEATDGVGYFTPDEFLRELETAATPAQPASPSLNESPIVRKGYAVKRQAAALSPEERAAREQAAITQMAKAMKKPGRK